jgi:TrmH family RNA methyltransferase
VRDGKVSAEIFIEGYRLADEALKAGLKIKDALFSADFAQTEAGKVIFQRIAQTFHTPVVVENKIFNSICDTKTPPGIVLIAEKPQIDFQSKIKNQKSKILLVVLHQLNNPANLGAIFRTAEAVGVTGIILTKGSSDVYSPKALRGSMGAAFRVPVLANIDFREVIEFCQKSGLKTYCADIKSAKTHSEIDWRSDCVLILGSEAHGLSEEEIELANDSFRIPMKSGVESLNVAVAGGIVLYEALRQRNFQFFE